MPEIKVSEPKIEAEVEVVQVGVPVAPTQVILFPKRGISAVTVCEAEKALSMTTSSCGNGTREVHLVASDQFPPLALIQCWVTATVKVIPLLPPQSPIEVPVQMPKPAPVISLKSALETTTVAAFKVALLPAALLLM